MATISLHDTQRYPPRSRSPSEERSGVQPIRTPAEQEKNYWAEDKVIYSKKIWNVVAVRWNAEKGDYMCDLKIEDGTETKSVLQQKITDIFTEGRFHGK